MYIKRVHCVRKMQTCIVEKNPTKPWNTMKTDKETKDTKEKKREQNKETL